MKKQKYDKMDTTEKIAYLIKKLGKNEVLDYLIESFNSYQLEFIVNEMAEDFDLIEE